MLASLLAVPGAAAAPAGSPESFAWFAVSDLVKVFEDGYGSPIRRNSIEVFGIRGEVVTAQCVLAADEALTGVTVEVDGLAHEGGGPPLPQEAVSWNFVGSVPVPANTPWAIHSRLARIAPARFPDYLAEDRSAEVGAGKHQPVWITVRIPAGARAGRYSGRIAAKTSRGSAFLPFHLTVYPLDLPDERHLKVALWLGTRQFAEFHGAGDPDSERYFEVLKNYARVMAEHRNNVYRIDLTNIRIRQDGSGRLHFDFSRFDRLAELFFRHGRMDYLEVGFVGRFGKDGFYDRSIVFRDCRAVRDGKEVTLPGEEVFPHLLPALEKHLEERGWLEKTLLHVADEPTNWNVRSWRRMSEQVRKWAPRLKRMDAIEATGFRGALEVWVPKLNHFGTFFDEYRKAQQEGYEFWYYLAMPLGNYPNRYIDYPLIEARLLHWVNYRYQLRGFLHWGLNSWTANPFEKMNDEKYGAGDAWIAYPKKDGILSSIRWAAMRNGVQDYEYFWLLEERYRQLKRRLGAGGEWIQPSQRGVEIASKVVRELDDYTRDPERLYAAKQEVLAEILDFERPPRVIVQTTPAEGKRLVYSNARIEVRGWTEPGVEIKVDGKAVPVAADGYFDDAPQFTPQRNVIVVEARKGALAKTIRRAFWSVDRGNAGQ